LDQHDVTGNASCRYWIVALGGIEEPGR
jgi:hypothetical protein